MQNWVNFLRGSLWVEVTGAFPERFLNLCAQSGVIFWSPELPNQHTLRLRIARQESARTEELARRVGCEITVLERSGLPHFLRRFRRRYALLLGLALALCAVAVLSRFVLTVDVSGNQSVPTARILEELKRLGVRPGVYGPSIDENLVCNQMRLALDDLSWIAVNLHGTRAEVLVAERTPKPAVVNEKIPAHIVADGSGIITKMRVLNGQAKFHVGDTVVEGDILISGIMDLEEPQYSTIDMGTLTVHSEGIVQARTWRTLSAIFPLEATVKTYSGQKTDLWSLTFFSRRLQFYKNGGLSYERYDTIVKSHSLSLPQVGTLPIALTRETVREYHLTAAPIDPEAAEELLRTQLEARLKALVDAHDGQVVSTAFSSAQSDGMLTVTLTAECSEQIGKTVEFDGEIGRYQPGVTE